MKKNVLRIALLGFLLAGLSILGIGHQVQAQNTTLDQLFQPPTGSFVSPSIALQRLDEAVVTYKNTMLNYPPNSAEYRLAFKKYSYYNAVTNLIVEGKTVPVAIVEGLKIVATDAYEISPKDLPVYKLELVNLLKA